MVFVKAANSKVNYVFEINNRFFQSCSLNMIQDLSDEQIRERKKVIFIITLILWLGKELAIRHIFKYFVCMCMMFKLLRLYENTKTKIQFFIWWEGLIHILISLGPIIYRNWSVIFSLGWVAHNSFKTLIKCLISSK